MLSVEYKRRPCAYTHGAQPHLSDRGDSEMVPVTRLGAVRGECRPVFVIARVTYMPIARHR